MLNSLKIGSAVSLSSALLLGSVVSAGATAQLDTESLAKNN